MISWGISANSHDAALAVFCDEKLVFASHSERFSGKKNDRDLCWNLVDHARKKYGEPSRVYWYENPYFKTLRQLFAGQGLKWKESRCRLRPGRLLSTIQLEVTSKLGKRRSRRD